MKTHTKLKLSLLTKKGENMARNVCDECGGKLEKKAVVYTFLGEDLGKFPAEVCTKCGEQVFEEEVIRKIAAVTKQKGLWGLNERAKINQVGGSVGITINKKIADFLHLRKGEEVILYPETKKRLVIQIP